MSNLSLLFLSQSLAYSNNTRVRLTQCVQIGLQSGLDWPQMGQIWDFLKSGVGTFWITEKLSDLLRANLTYLGVKSDTTGVN